MSWFKKLFPSKVDTQLKKGVPEGLWTKCFACNAVLYKAELEHQLFVCPKCNHHQRIPARVCLNYFLDAAGQQEIGTHVHPVDRLRFRDTKKYKDRLQAAQKQTGETEALIVLAGTLNDMPVVAAAFNFSFIGGSMSPAVGERFVLGAMHALEEKIPYICFCASGGARMQEGLCSLFQMAKTSAALAKLSEAGVPFISVLMDPTMGGVSASLAMLGDIIVAEPGALIGFAGPRVIEQTMRQVLPPGFQSSEFLLEHGAIDMIVDRRQMRKRISAIVAKLMHHPEILSGEA